jgi:hypothetical protein
MDITKASEVELKALAYDEVVKLEQSQTNLRIINQELAKRRNQPIDTAKKNAKQ